MADSEGNVPLWDAMLGNHEHVINLLMDNGGNLKSGDMGHFACTAAEKNNLELLKEIVRHGGDVTKPRNNGSTALHVAVCEDNIEMVRFLLDQMADIDKPDVHGWTPRELADQQGHEDIQLIFQSFKETRTQPIGRFTSEPAISGLAKEGSFRSTDGTCNQSCPRRGTNNFHNSLFGIMSAVHTVEKDLLFSGNHSKHVMAVSVNPTRVTISCPERGVITGKLVLLPASLQKLLEIGAKKFGISAGKILSKEGAEIDNIDVIKDGDHLIFVSDGDQSSLNRGTTV